MAEPEPELVLLIDVGWAWPVNVLAIVCEPCGVGFRWPSNVSLVKCPRCGVQELWHEVEPKPATGPWSEPVMMNLVNVISRPSNPGGRFV